MSLVTVCKDLNKKLHYQSLLSWHNNGSSLGFRYKSHFILLTLCERHFLVMVQVILGLEPFILPFQYSFENFVVCGVICGYMLWYRC